MYYLCTILPYFINNCQTAIFVEIYSERIYYRNKKFLLYFVLFTLEQGVICCLFL